MDGGRVAGIVDMSQRRRGLRGDGDDAVHGFAGRGDRFDAGHVDQDAALARKAEAGLMLGQEIGAHGVGIGQRHVEQTVRAVIAQAQQRFGAIGVGQVGPGVIGERIERSVQSHLAQRQGQRPFPHRAAIGQTHAIGRQHAAQRVDHHPVHAQRVGDQAGMLPARPAEAGERIARHIMAPRDGDALDRVRHAGDGDGDEALRRVAGRHGAAGVRLHLRAKGGEARLHRLGIERLVAVRTEQAGEMGGLDLAQHDVAVGDGERATAPIAGRTGDRARAFRADAETAVDEGTDGAAARRDGVDAHHRRAQADAGHARFIVALIGAGIMGHIGRRAAHVETDDFAEARLLGRAGEADDAAGRTGQDGVLAPEQRAVGQAATRLHEQHVGVFAQGIAQAIDIGAQDGGEIGVRQRGIAATDQLDERRDVMAGADLGKADIGGDADQCPFVGGMEIAVHQHDRDGAQTLVIGGLQRGAGGGFIQRRADGAVGHHSLVDFDHIGMQRIGQDDAAGEQVRPFLRADADRVAITARDRQQHRFALALQQSVGGDGGADAQGAGRDRAITRAGQAAHRFHRRVGIAFRVARQQFGGVQLPVGRACHHIGEGAAAVDPEMPCHGAGDGGAGARWQGLPAPATAPVPWCRVDRGCGQRAIPNISGTNGAAFHPAETRNPGRCRQI